MRKDHINTIETALAMCDCSFCEDARHALGQLAESFQKRLRPWMIQTFGIEVASFIPERNDRFLEEALELVQSTGFTRSRAHALVEYVFNRPVGETKQEVGGVMVTLAALCNAIGIDVDAEADDELERIWTKIDVIREKQKTKQEAICENSAPIAHVIEVMETFGFGRKRPAKIARWHTDVPVGAELYTHPVFFEPTESECDEIALRLNEFRRRCHTSYGQDVFDAVFSVMSKRRET